MPQKILVVEDDAVLRGGLSELFVRQGYDVLCAASLRQAQMQLCPAVDLIVLDVTLPDGDGVSLCKQWRSEGIVQPVLFLTAKGEEFDVVRGLDAGGDDYVTKPFRMQELLSRMRALLRRAEGPGGGAAGFEVDAERMQVKKDGEVLALTLTEYKLVTLLLKTKGVVERDKMLCLLWDDGAKFVDDNTLSVHLSRLRDKVGAAHIRTVRGVGYQWED